MNTPIYDFVRKYSEGDFVRAHMPGHKGVNLLGIERFDITEIDGADYLYDAEGIIGESEKNATEIFGTRETLYSTEGSSLSIKTMVMLVRNLCQEKNHKTKIIAGRNAHKSFVYAAALCDVDIVWLLGDCPSSLFSCKITADELEHAILQNPDAAAVYVTSPDYLGGELDICSLSNVCHAHGLPILVDNAHGAYLKFTEKSRHPIDLGADMCCDSAHKQLPVLTGGAYLHVSKSSIIPFEKNAKKYMEIFGSTSPSFPILASLDRTNDILSCDFRERTMATAKQVEELKKTLSEYGYKISPSDELRLTIDARSVGYSGDEVSEHLKSDDIFVELHDSDFVVMMFTAYTPAPHFKRVEQSLLSLKLKQPLPSDNCHFSLPKKILTVHDSVLRQSEVVETNKALNCILALSISSCPPCISIGVPGEQVDENMIELCEKYSIRKLTVVKKDCM